MEATYIEVGLGERAEHETATSALVIVGRSRLGDLPYLLSRQAPPQRNIEAVQDHTAWPAYEVNGRSQRLLRSSARAALVDCIKRSSFPLSCFLYDTSANAKIVEAEVARPTTRSRRHALRLRRVRRPLKHRISKTMAGFAGGAFCAASRSFRPPR